MTGALPCRSATQGPTLLKSAATKAPHVHFFPAQINPARTRQMVAVRGTLHDDVHVKDAHTYLYCRNQSRFHEVERVDLRIWAMQDFQPLHDHITIP